MRRFTTFALLGAFGIAVALAGARAADEPNKGGQGPSPKMMAGHGLAMIIDGTSLRGASEELAGGQPGQPNQPQNQPGRPGQPQQGQQAQQGQENNPARLLMMHAQREIQEGQRLIRDAESEGSCDASCQRLFNAISRYSETLCSLCGASNEKEASAERERNQPGEARMGANLSGQDKAAIVLVNHSVKSAIIGSMMSRGLAQHGGQSEAHQQLQKHAQEMATEGRDLLDRFIASRQQAGGNAPGQQQQRNSPVLMLAVQGRELLEAWNAASDQRQGNQQPQGGQHQQGGQPRPPGTGD